MADEFTHKDPGSALTQAEYIASDGTGHVFESQAQGDILYADSATVLKRLGKDANSTRVLTNTGTNNNPAWAQVTLTSGVTGTLPVANGGTNATSLTDKAVLISQDSGTDTVGSVALSSSGQIIIGGSSGPAAATLSAGSNVTITNGDGSISIAASGGIASVVADTSPQLGGNLDMQARLLVGNGGSTGIAISANGEVTMAAQPLVIAYNSATDSNVTGNGATATVDFDTELADQNADFASDTFTAPVPGPYLVLISVRGEGFTASDRPREVRIETSNRTWYSNTINGSSGESTTAMASALVDMDADDTFTVTYRVRNESSDVVDIGGDSAPLTNLSVRLV